MTAESPTTLIEHHHLINYNKFRVTAKIIRQFRKFQNPDRSPYPFQRHDTLYDTMWGMTSLPPKELFALSKAREPTSEG